MADYTSSRPDVTNRLSASMEVRSIAASATVRFLSPLGSGSSPPPAVPTYAQRVFSTGLGAWCYYNGPLDDDPAPSATTPPWTGSISAWQVLGRLS